MDSLRITLLIIGAVVIAVIYAWERIKRRKKQDRYAHWGVSDDAETHIVGRNSGDPETDSRLVSTAYDTEHNFDRIYDEKSDDIDPDFDIPDVQEEQIADYEPTDIEPSPEKIEINDKVEDWQSEVTASLDDAVHKNDLEPDLDSDPQLSVNPIDDITSELEALEEIISHEPELDEMDLGNLDIPIDEPAATTPDRVIAIHVLAREGSIFSGADILHHLMGLDLQHGDMDIFHRSDEHGKTIFSMANAIEPGTFDIANMDELSTPALLFILSIPNPVTALEAYDSMLDAARSLADAMNGRLCDETRSVLTRQAIDAQRTELNAL